MVTSVGYRLLDLTTIFARRYDKPTFYSPSALAGDNSGGCGNGFSPIFPAIAMRPTASGHTSPAKLNPPIHGTGEDPATLFGALFSFSGGLTPPTERLHLNKFLHQKCDPQPGQAAFRRMKGSADPCVQQICAVDPYCCNNAWDTACSSEVASVCGKTCSNCNANICQYADHPDRNRL